MLTSKSHSYRGVTMRGGEGGGGMGAQAPPFNSSGNI